MLWGEVISKTFSPPFLTFSKKVVGSIPILGPFCMEFVCSPCFVGSLASFLSPKNVHEVN